MFYLEQTPTGFMGTLHTPDQAGAVIPLSKVEWKKKILRLDGPRIGMEYSGKFAADGGALVGIWRQEGGAYPLELRRVGRVEDVPRPQTPRPPFPYREEQVVFPSVAPGVSLAGTLTLPGHAGPHPAVALVGGSGPNGRDEVLLRHPVFLVWADYLTRRGFAVLRYDKRGVGQSTGSFAAAAGADFADDARGAFQFLLSRPDIDPARTGLVGHSEGATLAPMVAASRPGVAFLVLVGAPGVPGDQLLLGQKDLVGRAAGTPEEELATQRAQGEAVDAMIHREKDSPELETDLKKLLKAQHGEEPAQVAKAIASPWFRSFLTTDPKPVLEKVTCPVLAVTGGLDLQVPAPQNLPRLEAALRAGGNRDTTMVVLPGLNHLLQEAKTGSPVEYGEIEQTSSPAALKLIGDWLADRARRDPA
jgi:pimeloyl-ACP methyl ester carboxylesterase